MAGMLVLVTLRGPVAWAVAVTCVGLSQLCDRFDGVVAYAQTKRAEVILSDLWAEHFAGTAVFRDFGIGSDIYYTTHSEETRRHAERIFAAMRDAGLRESSSSCRRP